MKIILKKKNDVSDKDPLIVQYLEGEEGKQRKVTLSVAIGDTIELPDDTAFEVMGKYRGMFALASEANVSEKTASASYQGKSLKSYQDKAGPQTAS